MALAHSARIHVERTGVDALRVIVRACSVLWVWQLSDNRIEPRIMISLSDVFKPNRTLEGTFKLCSRSNWHAKIE